MKKPFLLLLFLFRISLTSHCQCSVTAPTSSQISSTGMTGVSGLTWSTWATAPTGCPTTGTSVSNGSTISGSSSAGSLYYVPSGSNVSATLSMGSSTDSIKIVVCGGGVLNLTRGGSVNSTRVGILVMPGGTLRTPSAYGFPGKHWLYGAYIVSTDMTIQDANTRFYIAKTGVFQVASTTTTSNSLTLNSSTLGFYAEGSFDLYNFYLNSSPSPFLCVNNASACIRVRGTYGTSNTANQIDAGTNGGTLKLDLTSGSVTFNKTVSNSSNLSVCSYGATYCYSGGTCCTGSCATQSTSAFPNTKYNTNCSSIPSTCNIPLAIKLLYFRATESNEGVTIRWATALENHSSLYVVERSTDNISWEKVGETKAVGASEYSLIDAKPGSGYIYYRLIEVEDTGKETIQAFGMAQVERPEAFFRLYPNPSKGTFVAEVSDEYGHYRMDVMDVTGKTVGTYTLSPGANTISDIVAPGVYFALLKIKNEVKAQRFLVQR